MHLLRVEHPDHALSYGSAFVPMTHVAADVGDVVLTRPRTVTGVPSGVVSAAQ